MIDPSERQRACSLDLAQVHRELLHSASHNSSVAADREQLF
jgi:hypothetical protein